MAAKRLEIETSEPVTSNRLQTYKNGNKYCNCCAISTRTSLNDRTNAAHRFPAYRPAQPWTFFLSSAIVPGKCPLFQRYVQPPGCCGGKDCKQNGAIFSCTKEK